MNDNVAEEEEAVLDAPRVEQILDAVEAEDAPRLATLLEPLHPADTADLLEQVSGSERRELLALAPELIDGDVLSELEESLREEIIETLSQSQLAEAMRDLDTDDVVDIIEDLDEPQQAAILGSLDVADRVAIEQSLAYPEYSAGRLMQREVVMAPEHWTVGEAIDYMRSADHLPEQFYHVILIDPRTRPTGYATLGRVLSSSREVRLKDVVEDSFRSVEVTTDEADVAYIFNKYHLISCPVVDETERLVGVITIDDAMNVLDDEHEEDMLRLAAVGGDTTSVSEGPFSSIRTRLPWLVANLFTASISSFVIAQFESTIAAIVALAAVMPIVASTGGIGGTQSLAVAVRALATRELTSANAARVVRRELVTGLTNGLGLALILFIGGSLIYGDWRLGAVLAMAMIVNQIVAALGGVLVPLGLERVGLDPALASGTFVTTLTDVMGYLSFLGLATVLLL